MENTWHRIRHSVFLSLPCTSEKYLTMEYSKLISVSGLPGLFELVGSKTDGAIARSLVDQQTRFISSRQHQFSHLESIEVYTTRENVNLAEVFIAMKKSTEALPNEKDDKAVKAYFQKAFPSIDFDRVYPSDLRKMVKWYALLDRHQIEPVLPAAEEEASEQLLTGAGQYPFPLNNSFFLFCVLIQRGNCYLV